MVVFTSDHRADPSACATPQAVSVYDPESTPVPTRPPSVLTKQSSNEFSVYFSENDERNPLNFTRAKKWRITVVAATFTVLVSASATSYSQGSSSMMKDLNCTQFQATMGLSLYCLGFGILPLITSSSSEEFGRQPLYYISVFGFLLMHLMTALSPNIQSVLVARFLQGSFGSTGATMVAGTVADIWAPSERGLPMSMYSLGAFLGNALGALMGGWVETNRHLGWRWIQWIHFIIGGVYYAVMLIIIRETRASVILNSMARKLRKSTGDSRYQSAISRNSTFAQMMYDSCTRPVKMLCTEPIVFAFSLWVGIAWGVYFERFTRSIPGVFKVLHGFNQGEVGTVYMTMAVGSLLGFFTNMYQEKLYQRDFLQRGPQARLHLSCVAGLLFALSMFMFAWSSTPEVPWVVLVIALTIYIWAVFTIYLAVFSYLADCYSTYASSALSGQSLFRNVMSFIFPLFTEQMFHALGFRWANTVFAFAALAMAPVPLVGPILLWPQNLSEKLGLERKRQFN
ncbi:MFS general substrate transporter [Agrocybe pediades]|nr:MFS general substrate transporter [Agrocybe pediades]